MGLANKILENDSNYISKQTVADCYILKSDLRKLVAEMRDKPQYSIDHYANKIEELLRGE
jgi:hypothetical protein